MEVDGGSPSSCQIREGYLSRMLNSQKYKAWRTGHLASRGRVPAEHRTRKDRETDRWRLEEQIYVED